MSLKNDLRVIQDHLSNGDLLLGTREFSRLLKEQPRFRLKRAEVETSRRRLERLQKRWQTGRDISAQDHLTWISTGLSILNLLQEVQARTDETQAEDAGNVLPPAPPPALPAYQWYETGVLHITIEGRPYFLQGLSAAIFHELVHAPLFLEQLPAGAQSRRDLIENLAIALATHDRRHTTRRALNVLQILWSQERASGMTRFIELLQKDHWQNSTWHSDHLDHILKVYLTGLYLYLRCEAFRRELRQGSHCDERTFLRRWLYVSTLHDLGYLFELATPPKQYETLAFIQDYLLHFFAFYDRDMADELASAGIAPGTIDAQTAQKLCDLCKIKTWKLQNLDDLALLSVSKHGHQRGLLELLDSLCQQTGIGEHGISAYYRACLAPNPPRANGRQPFYDHGITAAMLLLYVGHMLHAVFTTLHKNLSVPAKYAQMRRTGRSEVLEKMDEWGKQCEQHLETVEQTAAAIALHNIYKHLWKIGEVPAGIDLPNFWIRLDREPLAFLLVLVDTLQNWDLPGFSPLQPPEDFPMSGEIDLEPDAQRILLRYPYQASEYANTIQHLKTILLPIQVDHWLAPLGPTRLSEIPLASDRTLAAYNQKMINRLKNNHTDPFIDAQLLPVNLRMEPGKPGDHTYTIFEISEQIAQKPVVLLGAAGIGKTTLVKHLAIHYAETGERVPVFVDLASSSSSPGVDLPWLDTLRQSIGEIRLNRLLEEGKLIVIFDGLNEVNSEQRRNAARNIASFINTYTRNQCFITCRTAEYPHISTDVRHFEVLPVNPREVLPFLVKTLGSQQGKLLYTRLPPVIRDLCRVPLILAMLVYINRGTENQQPRNLPVSKVALYQEFLSHLFRREESLHSSALPFMLREEFLIYLAQKMENTRVAIKIQKAVEWIEEFYYRRYHDRDPGISLPTILHEVLDFPPLLSSKPGPHIDIDISFMHQTFQEYYTARALLHNLQQGKITLKEIAAYPLSSPDAWLETLTLLVGMMDDATPLIRTLKAAAIERKDRRLLHLVAACIGEAQRVTPSEVDSVILHIILEFKYGAVTFDYDLIESLKSIKAEKRTREFPNRLIDDMQWWVTKYAKERGMNLGHTISIATLLAYLESDDETLVLNALSTLRGHPQRKAAAGQLVNKLQYATGTVREQTMITLGYLAGEASAAVELLIGIMGNRAESDLARTHAAAALSRIGDITAVEQMLEIVCDHTYQYRDTACWAPLGIVKLHPQEHLLIKRLKEVLMEDLLQEPETREGNYARGNALYVLGELGATEYAAEIASWLEQQTEAYVIEDGIHALGLIGGKQEVATIRARLHHEDLAVRMIAAQALAALQQRVDRSLDVLADLQALLTDKTTVVREYVAEILKQLYAEDVRLSAST